MNKSFFWRTALLQFAVDKIGYFFCMAEPQMVPLSNAITSREVIENSLVLGLFLVTFLLNIHYIVVTVK